MNADFQSCTIDSLQTKQLASAAAAANQRTTSLASRIEKERTTREELEKASGEIESNSALSSIKRPVKTNSKPQIDFSKSPALGFAIQRGNSCKSNDMNIEEKPTNKVIANSNNNQQLEFLPKHSINNNNNNYYYNIIIDRKHAASTAKTSANQLNKPSSLADINRINDSTSFPTTLTKALREQQATLIGGCNSTNFNYNNSSNQILTNELYEEKQQLASSKVSSSPPNINQTKFKQLFNQVNLNLHNQKEHICRKKCVVNNIEDQFSLDSNYSNSNFWKFISNLPKSILQRRNSASGNLSSEVLGYLERFAPMSDNISACKVVNTTLADSSTSLASPSTINKTENRKENLTDIEANKLTVTKTNKMSSSSSANLASNKSSKALVENVQLQERLSGSTTDVHKLIKISSPGEPPTTSLVFPASTNPIGSQQTPTKHQHANKLSIATTITTRSSVSSISSCILSSSSTSEVRLKWGKKMDFLLSIIGFAVDLANIWRFPYLVYKNGGGVFFIPYVIMLIFGGIPLFFLELCLGQFVKKGPITVWNKICPSMKGVGYCSILVSWYVSFYYNVLIAWSVYFIYRSILSFNDKMPWEDCDNSWNSKGTCVSISKLKELCAAKNDTIDHCRRELFSSVNVTSPAAEFFVKELSQLDQSTGLDDMGYLRPELVLCLMIVYLLHYMSLFRGLETSGKVVWVTATAPYIILSILLVRGLFLPGAFMGIEYYLSPKLERLKDPQVWIDAAGQVFYSIGVGFGVHLTYASFNSHNNNCHRDCLMTSAVNAVTSAYSGLVVFIYLGYMAQNLGIEIDKVASEGYSLIFEVYPEALTTLPFARFWSILFFIMLLTLGIDSAMGGLESVITGLEDEFKFAKRLSRGQLTGLVIISSFLPALISCTQGGAYTIFWFDIYSAGVSLLFSALFETIGVVYCYGLKKFILNIESMLGKRPHIFYLLCWKYISPLFLGGVIVMSIITAQVPVYRNYTFPVWSIVLGWCLAFSSVAVVPLFALWYCLTNQKSKRITSSPERRKKDRSSVGSSKKTPTNYTPVSVTCPNHAHQATSVGAQSAAGTLLTTTTITTILNNHQDML